jgi:hypothetical protein
LAGSSDGPPRFVGKLIGSGFNFQSLTRKDIEQVRAGRTDADLVALYRSRVDTRKAPPGPATSWLGETIVHGEDIFRAGDQRPDPGPGHGHDRS